MLADNLVSEIPGQDQDISRTGQVLWETRLESEGHTTPMTYLAPNGKQYVVVVTTGVNAFALE